MSAPITSATIIDKRLKTLFAEHGIPDRLLSDNGGHYSSQAFRTFASKWGFDHVTSSPYHTQSNGLTERTMQSMKNILKKSELPDVATSTKIYTSNWMDTKPRRTALRSQVSKPFARYLPRRPVLREYIVV